MFSITHITEFSYSSKSIHLSAPFCWRPSPCASLTSRPGCADIVAQNIRTARAARACRLSVLSLAVLIFYASWSLSRGSMLGYRRTQSFFMSRTWICRYLPHTSTRDTPLCKLFSYPGGNILCFCHRFLLSTCLHLRISHVPDMDMWLSATDFG